jgi:hypothetical protein
MIFVGYQIALCCGAVSREALWTARGASHRFESRCCSADYLFGALNDAFESGGWRHRTPKGFARK